MKDKRGDKRTYLRIDRRIPITVKSLVSDWEEQTETENFSTHGCLFSVKQDVRIGEQLKLAATAPDAEINCEVIRYTPKQGLVGVKFSPNYKWIELFVHYATPAEYKSNF